MVRADTIYSVQRDDIGKLRLTLRKRTDRLEVSHVYGGVFRGM